ncbi:hypothetical protein MAR_027840 [Mya arenaria]|uniref:Uncharacterized protein n=1 Tax=Mya arenaria TaxID=6604 RepID=A0ABY7EWJ4_MYAAR|nr:hypothetical protein MAR_027840 [Mya arenaria]
MRGDAGSAFTLSFSCTTLLRKTAGSTWEILCLKKTFQLFQIPTTIEQNRTDLILPEYACAQLAKYDVISRASRDVGYFRDRKSINKFLLSRPNCCNESRVAMNVFHANTHMAMSVTNIFRNNLLWVGGGLVFANRDIILRYRSSSCVRVV